MANKGAIKAGEVRNPKGRPKGCKNKTSRETQQEIIDSLRTLDGLRVTEGKEKGKLVHPHGFLVSLAHANMPAYAGLLGRVLPKDVSITADVTVTIDELISRRGQKD